MYFYIILFITLNIKLALVCGAIKNDDIFEYKSLIDKAIAKTLRDGQSLPENVCHEELNRIAVALAEKLQWADRLSLASGFPKGSLHLRNAYWPGSSRQCLLPQPTMENHSSLRPPFPVSYFLLPVRHDVFEGTEFNLNSTKTLELCLPASCAPQQIITLFSDILDDLFLRVQNLGQSYEDEPLYIVFRYSTITILILAFIGTMYGSYFGTLDDCDKDMANETGHLQEQGNEIPSGLFHDCVVSFSITKNFSKIFSMEVDKDMLMPLNGWRFINIMAMIHSHTMAFQLLTSYERGHSLETTEVTDPHVNQTILFTTYFVDNFFVVSGFLLGYYFFKKNDIFDQKCERDWRETGKDYLKGILKRYLRLTPQYLYTILAGSAWSAAYSPDFNLKEQLDETCAKYWWTNILYINNLYPTYNSSCMSWSYYLANEMQYYVLGNFLLHLALFKWRASLVIGLTAIFLSCLKIAHSVVSFNYYPLFHLLMKYVDYFYTPPWIRITAYLLGIYTSYIYVNHRDLITRKPWLKYLLWFLFGGGIIYSGVGLLIKDVTLWYSAFYTVASRQIWAVSAASFFFCLFTNNIYGKMITFFSYGAWIPLAKFCYGAYLLNPLILAMSAINVNKGSSLYDFHNAISSFGVISMTFFCSFWMVILIETPVSNLVNAFSSKQDKKECTSDEQIENEYCKKSN